MRENVEGTVRMLAEENREGKNCVWDREGCHAREAVWQRHMHTYRSRNGKYLVHEIHDNEVLDEAADYMREFGHMTAVDRARHIVFADGEKIEVRSGKRSSVERTEEGLILTLRPVVPESLRRHV